jgi:hypothetical protein
LSAPPKENPRVSELSLDKQKPPEALAQLLANCLLRVPSAVSYLMAFKKQRYLSAEFGTSFGTACVQDFTSSLGCHARTETVAVFANQVRWLKCAFHRRLRQV